MKTQALTRIYALAMSAVFATIATVGVAVVMTSTVLRQLSEMEKEIVRNQRYRYTYPQLRM